MKIYKEGENSITLSGQTFVADSDGIIDIPNRLQPGAWTQGFVSAKGRLAQLSAEAKSAQSTAPQPAATPVAETPVAAKPPTKPTTTTEKL